MSNSKFQFSNVVVVHGNQIGVVVKSWSAPLGARTHQENSYDIYVRSLNTIIHFKESEVTHFVYNKELLDEEVDSY